MSSVFKPAGRTNWMMQIRLPDGSRPPYRSTKTTDKTEARRMANEWEVRARKEFATKNLPSSQAFLRVVMDAERLASEGMLTASKAEDFVRRIRALADPDAKPITLRSHWTEFVNRQAPTVGDSWVNNTEDALKAWCRALGAKADRPLEKLRLDDLEKAFPKVAAGLAAETVRGYRSALRRALTDATGRGIIDRNPADGLTTVSKVGKVVELKETLRKGTFEPGEVAALLRHADDEWRGMVLFAFYTGVRMMNIARLSSDDIHDGFLVDTSDKTGTDTDTPLHPLLLKWLGDRKGPLFPNQRTKPKGTISSRFSAVMKRANVSKIRTVRGRDYKRTFHNLRHSFQSFVANAGIPEDTRLALAGSSDPKIARRYVHMSDESLMEGIAALPNVEFDPEAKEGAA